MMLAWTIVDSISKWGSECEGTFAVISKNGLTEQAPKHQSEERSRSER